MTKHNYTYQQLTDDIVSSHDQEYKLPDDYTILTNSSLRTLWTKVIQVVANIIGFFYGKLFLRYHVIGKKKIKLVKNQGYFVYGNHTQPFGDAVMPLTIFPSKNYRAIATQANWGIPFIGKYILPYFCIPVGENFKQTGSMLESIKTVITKQKGVIMIYPEAHVWPFYSKIRPFASTSMDFPVALNSPSFVITTTYQKPNWGARPKITVYIDGPFYPDKTLPKNQAKQALHDQIYAVMQKRAESSTYHYYNYTKKA